MRIVPIPCLTDNYAYLLVCDETREAAIVDASEAEPIQRALAEEIHLTIGAILSTHHHHDHVGANLAIARSLGITRTFGHASDRGRIPGQTEFLEDGDTFRVGHIDVVVKHVPGHTRGAITYVATSPGEPPAAFTGDTLFIAGAGRLFEGDAETMHASLSKIAALDPAMRIYCGHEYTEANLRFAASVEKTNVCIMQAQARAAELRKEGLPTVGTTLADELRHNPFLRASSAEIRASLGISPDAPDAQAWAAVRAAKNVFRSA
jgi:hydroxyacylglutathione hydrolase